MEWFRAKLSDPQSLFLIIEDERGSFLGQARFDAKGEKALISISLVKEARGKGLSGKVIASSCRHVFEHFPQVAFVEAMIKPENIVSQKTFAANGFVQTGRESSSGLELLRYELKRPSEN